jgi:dipeptidyl aminopeptidase/acylaminoacyl peptidase
MRLARGLAGVLLTAAVYACLAAPAPAAFPGANGVILHSYSRDVQYPDGCHPSPSRECHGKLGFVSELEALNGAGQIVRRHPLAGGGVAVSPDGRRIAFSRNRSGELMVADATGAHARRIARGVGGSVESWSPDGRKLLVIRDVGAHRSVFVVSVRGGRVRRLTRGNLDLHPRWSPDGDRIAFLRMANSAGGPCPRAWSVWTMSSRAGPAHVLYRPGFACGGVGSFDWAPDGDRLAVVVAGLRPTSLRAPPPQAGNDRPGLAVVSETGGIRHVADGGGSVLWSPDGHWLAFTDGTSSYERCAPTALYGSVCVIRPDGSELHLLGQLTTSPSGFLGFLDWAVQPRSG